MPEKNPHTSPETDPLTPAERKGYVAACIVKQCAVTPEVAAQRVAELTAKQIAEIREAGRLGQVREVRELLLTAFATPPAKKGRGKDKDESQNAD